LQEKFKDTKELIRSRQPQKNRQYNGLKINKRTKGQTTIYKTLHRKLLFEQHEPHHMWHPSYYSCYKPG